MFLFWSPGWIGIENTEDIRIKPINMLWAFVLLLNGPTKNKHNFNGPHISLRTSMRGDKIFTALALSSLYSSS